MIFRYSITTICMLALASISIAMNQDQVRESLPDKNSTERQESMLGQQEVDPFRQQQANPFGQQEVETLLQWQGNPFRQQEVDPFRQRWQWQGNAFGQRQNSMLGQQQASPFAQQQKNAFGARVRAAPQLDRETAKFNSTLAQLTQALKATESGSGKSDLQDEIQDLLESEYDRQLNKQDAKLVQMEQRLENLREKYNRQKDAKDKLVEMRMTSIISDVEGLGWPTDRRAYSDAPQDLSKSPLWNVNGLNKRADDRHGAGFQRPAHLRGRKVFDSLADAAQEYSQRRMAVPNRRLTEQTIMPYRIQVGDTLKIGSANDSSLNQDAVSVLTDGMISLPLIGQVRAAGTTIDKLQQQLDERYEKFVKEPGIYVQVVQYPQRELRSSGDKSFRTLPETTATIQTLQGMAELAKSNNWKPLEKIGQIILTYEDENEQLVSVDLKLKNDLLARALETAAEENLYFNTENKYRWDIKLDDEEYKLYVVQRLNNSTTSAVVTNSIIKSIPQVDLMMGKIESRLADNDADNDSVAVDFENDGRLVILSGDPGAVKEAEEVINELMSQSKNK